jgi:hypothetical protein
MIDISKMDDFEKKVLKESLTLSIKEQGKKLKRYLKMINDLEDEIAAKQQLLRQLGDEPKKKLTFGQEIKKESEKGTMTVPKEKTKEDRKNKQKDQSEIDKEIAADQKAFTPEHCDQCVTAQTVGGKDTEIVT